MKKLGAVLAGVVVTLAAIASTTYGHNEPRTVSQMAPLQMMAGQHLPPQQMTDLTVVFEQ